MTREEAYTAAFWLIEFISPDSTDTKDKIATALIAAYNAGLEDAASIFEAKIKRDAGEALWMGPNRERLKGVPPTYERDWEWSPMNGPALAIRHHAEDATTIRDRKIT